MGKKCQEARNKLLKKVYLRICPFFEVTQQDVYNLWNNEYDDPATLLKDYCKNTSVLGRLEVCTDTFTLAEFFHTKFPKSDLGKKLIERHKESSGSVTAIRITGLGLWYLTGKNPVQTIAGCPYLYLPLLESANNLARSYYAYPERAFLSMFKTANIDLSSMKEPKDDTEYYR